MPGANSINNFKSFLYFFRRLHTYLFFKYVFFLLFSGASLLNASDSIKRFKLEDYIPPEYKYSSLKFNPSIRFNGSNNTTTYRREYHRDTPGSSPLPSSEKPHSEENLSLSMVYTLDYFSSKFEFYNKNILGFILNNGSRFEFYYKDLGRHYVTYNSYDNKSIRYYINIQNSLYYYPVNVFFIGFSFSPNIGQTPYHFSKSIGKSLDYNQDSDSCIYHFTRHDSKMNIVNLSLTSDISFGFGRIYNVTNAVVALNMLNRIRALKRNKMPHVNFKALADYIDKLKHRKKYESREALIDDIDSLYSYLNFKGIVDDSYPAARLIMELADQWQYGDKTKRESGYRYKIYPEFKIRVGWSNGKEKSYQGFDSIPIKMNYTMDYMENLYPIISEYSNEEKESGNHHIHGSICSDYTLKKMLNGYFQLDISISGKLGIVKKYGRYYTDVGFNQAFPEGDVRAYLSLGYYPNTRTDIKLSLAANYSREWDYYIFDHPGSKNSTITSFSIHDERELAITYSLSLSYYINPRFSFNINGKIDIEDDYSREMNLDEKVYLSFYTGLKYDIF